MTEQQSPKLGFIGLGLMGRPMAARLVEAGYEVYVWNRNPAKTGPLVKAGAKACNDPANVAAAAEVVFLCLTNGAAVEQVALGPDGIAEKGGTGKLVVDFSTIAPKATNAVASALYEKCGMNWIDAPVSGGVPGAEKGTLAIMCGGSVDQIDRVRPILGHLAARVTHMGDVGAGQITKLCNQLIVSTGILAIAEAIALGRKCGIDVEKLPGALAGGFADSIPLQLFGTRMATSSYEPKIGALSTMHKDIESIVTVTDEVGLDAGMARTARDIYRAAADGGLAEEDLGRLAEFYDKKSTG